MCTTSQDNCQYYTIGRISGYQIQSDSPRISSIRVESVPDYMFKENGTAHIFNILISDETTLHEEAPAGTSDLFNQLILARPTKNIAVNNSSMTSDLGNAIISLHQNHRQTKISVRRNGSQLELISLQVL